MIKPISPQAHAAARCLFDYLRMPAEPPAQADCMIVLGSKYLAVADYAGALCADGDFPLVIFTGGRGRNTSAFEMTEAETFERIARPHMPALTRVLLERHASNTGENIRFSMELLAQRDIRCRTFLFVQNATMTRRVVATVAKLLPDVPARFAAPDLPFDDYLASPDLAEVVIHDMVGNLQRLLLYPALGYQAEQAVPTDALDAYYFLLAQGFDGQLVAAAQG